MTDDLRLRPVTEDDLVEFFVHQLDPEANKMAAFGSEDPTDRRAFAARWVRILTGPENLARTVTVDGTVVGHVLAFPVGDRTEVSYWIDRARWGHGYATRALTALLREVSRRPLHARTATDNAASLAVLRRCGFVVRGTDRGYAPSRGHEIDEYVLELPASPGP
ncbi:Protein N-acetyltransferase, RimJ/RimL family [Micromonospora phaseoli]|uniref:Protein N-acetyltransferase, RimJ/RimL family n=1 Tax=Micromonospora phaseoli TaxID=1144548 RepID=A0A1H6TB06_9ACTN|nr:GNAT family N-acetyltransferase [Micromonospora phaseoli]PZW04177.1 RimJ/RimL family protein N-acetyltransferase [Micromonospora phaseoli]GIJ79363.1 N-acetyltransferase [Micromonospora phaseoli]SEI73480.1 Protein N-acetyltransferase, RimJ/RimL family [Micromonospora phaseoli]